MYKCHSYPKMSFDVFRCLVCRRLVFFCVAGPFIARCPGGPTVSIADWSKFCPVDFNRDSPVCLIFLPCTTSPAIFNPVFKASRPRVFAPFFNKGMAALKSPPKILPSPSPLWYLLPANIGYPFRLGVCNNRGKLSYRDDELVSF